MGNKINRMFERGTDGSKKSTAAAKSVDKVAAQTAAQVKHIQKVVANAGKPKHVEKSKAQAAPVKPAKAAPPPKAGKGAPAAQPQQTEVEIKKSALEDAKLKNIDEFIHKQFATDIVPKPKEVVKVNVKAPKASPKQLGEIQEMDDEENALHL